MLSTCYPKTLASCWYSNTRALLTIIFLAINTAMVNQFRVRILAQGSQHQEQLQVLLLLHKENCWRKYLFWILLGYLYLLSKIYRKGFHLSCYMWSRFCYQLQESVVWWDIPAWWWEKKNVTESERSGHPHLHVRQDGSDVKKTTPNDSNKQTDHSLAFLMETAYCWLTCNSFGLYIHFITV